MTKSEKKAPRKRTAASGKKTAQRMEASDRKLFDQLIVQQCVVRRFADEQPEMHRSLVEIRDGVLNLLLARGGDAKLSPIAEDSLSGALTSVFELFESCQGRECIRSKNWEMAARLIGVDEWASRPHWLLEDVKVLGDILDFLSQKLIDVEECLAKYNYMDYFSVLAMATKFSGVSAFCLFREAELGKRERWAAWESIEEFDFRFSRFLHLREEPADIDLACALRLSRRVRTFESRSVRILDSQQNPSSKRHHSDPRRVVLEIDLQTAPIDIDYALGYLSLAVKSLLIEEHKLWSRVLNAELYDKTAFAKGFNPPRLLREKLQYTSSLLGLWMWDLVHDQKLKRSDAQREVLNALNHPHLEDLLDHLTRIEGYIKPKRNKPRELDDVVTAPYGGRLGQREATPSSRT